VRVSGQQCDVRVPTGLLYAELFLVADPSIARVVALVSALAVLPGALGTEERRGALVQKAHQETNQQNIHESVKQKACSRWQSLCVRNPRSENSTHSLVSLGAGDDHVGSERNGVVERHLEILCMEIIYIP